MSVTEWIRRLSALNIPTPILVDKDTTLVFDDPYNEGVWISSDRRRLTFGKKPSDGILFGPGDKGDSGPQGDKGDKGDPGLTVTGPAGPTGPAGILATGTTVVGGTPGSVLFIDAAGKLAQDNANFFWDTATQRLGIGTNAPAYPLDVVGDIHSTSQFISTLAIGTAPLVVTSTTLVTNLNADLLDGQHGAYYATASGYVPYTGATSNVNLGVHTLTLADQIISTLAIGTSPFSVTSTTLNTNLNADLLDGQDASAFAPVGASYVTLAVDATLTNERVLTGTLNQITVTDGGAGSTVTLSTPQSIGTGSSPTFTGLTLSGMTLGSVLFAGTAGVVAQDNANLFWDDTNNTLGVGTTRTGAISGTNPSVRIKGTGATNATSAFEIQKSDSTTSLFVRNDGIVGIGTNNPGGALNFKFHVYGDQNSAFYSGIFQNANNGGSALCGFQVICNNASHNITIRQNSDAYAGSQFGVAGANLGSLYTNNCAFMLGCGDNFPVYIVTASVVRMFFKNTGEIGIGTVAPTNTLSFSGQAARTVWLERHTTANTAGNSLTIQAGGATVGATDKAGGDLILQPGVSTGTGESGVQIKGCVAGVTGTADRTITTAIQVLGNKVGFYNVAPVIRPTALTTQLTTVTCSAPGTPDYAIQDLVANGYGFVTADEAQSVIKVIANLQTRVAELETKLQGLGLLT